MEWKDVERDQAATFKQGGTLFLPTLSYHLSIGSLVRPKIQKSIHYCEATTRFHSREHRDFLALGGSNATSGGYPTTDEDGNPLTTEYGYSTYRDHQSISIQEMPERAPAGQLPRSIEIIMNDDMVDRCKPGDRIQLVGVYRTRGGGAGMQNGTSNFR